MDIPEIHGREGYEDEIDGEYCYDLADIVKFKFGYKDVNKSNARVIGRPEFRTTS